MPSLTDAHTHAWGEHHNKQERKNGFHHRHICMYMYTYSITVPTCTPTYNGSCAGLHHRPEMRQLFLQRSLGCIWFSVGTRTNWHICKGWIRTVDYLSFSDSWHFSWPRSRPKIISFSLLRDHHISATLFNVAACPYNHIDVFFITNELVIRKLCKSSSWMFVAPHIKYDMLFCFCFVFPAVYL